jgi:hypothetical protein
LPPPRASAAERWAIGKAMRERVPRTGDAAMLAGYCGNSDRLDVAMARFAMGYADQTEADHARLRKAIKDGKLEALEGVS